MTLASFPEHLFEVCDQLTVPASVLFSFEAIPYLFSLKRTRNVISIRYLRFFLYQGKTLPAEISVFGRFVLLFTQLTAELGE